MSSSQTTTILECPVVSSSEGCGSAIYLQHIPPTHPDNEIVPSNEPHDESIVDQQVGMDDWDKNEGWPVVAAGSAIFFVYLGLVYSYGIVQLHLSEARLANISTLAFIGSVGAAMSPLLAMVAARVIHRVGYRATSMIGSILLGLGEFTAGWSTRSVPAMFVTQGFIFGLGSAFLFLVRSLSPQHTKYNANPYLSQQPLSHRCGSRGRGDWRLVLFMAVRELVPQLLLYHSRNSLASPASRLP